MSNRYFKKFIEWEIAILKISLGICGPMLVAGIILGPIAANTFAVEPMNTLELVLLIAAGYVGFVFFIQYGKYASNNI